MTQASAFGRKLGRFLHLKDAPPSLITSSLRGVELAVTETRDDNPVPGLSGSFTAEDAFVVSLKLHDYPDCELWENGKCVMKADVPAGATYLYDLKRDPRYVIDKPFHSLFFYLPRSALDALTEQPRMPRVGQLACELGVGHDDTVVRHIGASLQQALRRPDETNQLFIDHMMLALTAHVAQAYGGLRPSEPNRGGLAPWQVKRVCERLESDLGGKLSLQEIAAEFDLSISHFSRAFRISTGLPPHQWLLRQRVKAAKQLMTVRDLSLSEIAISAGFANQSHFTRVFSSVVGVSPGTWRREAQGAPESEK
ncbi:helix-turn-helix transcriptional regulator [Bradyrhizobium sp. IC3069]|uniref:helix-turn-helix domain-containing protein n=1 Tax=unclassified Bradyrhizobium TaxID=2631580 RepID=UPI001CD59DEF|nr:MULTISPECIES: AraC family transcriptional regulator [unclassified Bradyrhizobium]MCA1361096.1 helix-turn-helix transcriptional regulator [Bradyrhizobium sp. IC4059]MCA1382583.1 helix-turn-helix transcriptional regulator [Bradyrhizobium sp. BRP05]MCA1421691.1 helix-turn-helix transcriptional regulator [Bradyrhizobium sp. BRP23]MCA1518102.1 helix-turn-helix transcriptional regulator [Bradyrhizobium sp. IC3069]